VIAPDALFISKSEQLGALTLHHAVPAITQFREFAAGGGLQRNKLVEVALQFQPAR
jgi:hypothetical protein